MRIHIFSDNVAPYRIGWADEMGKTQEVRFIYTKDKDAERNNSWLVKKSRFAEMVKIPARVIKNRAITFGVAKYIKKNPADIIVFDGYGPIPNVLGMLYCKRHNIDYFINVDGVEVGHSEGRLARMVKKKIFGKNAYFLVGSKYSANGFINRGIDSGKIYVHNFTSIYSDDILKEIPSKEERAAQKTELGIANKPTIIAVGRFLQLKQFDKLINAFAKYDDKYQLLIIGEGEEETVYHDMIESKGLNNVSIIPFMPLEQLKKYYFAADLLVLPSNSEVWGLVINEAMGFGALPIIASDRVVAAYSLIKEGKNGYIFPYDNEQELSKCIEKVLECEDASQMQNESLRIICEFTIENIAMTHIEIFKRYLKNKEISQ